ncbi:MAG: ATP-binding domain-containing protein, partial [Spirochaetes bacterium]|nr:ATP-binding domain-containing protein [Spirochaetota bacterium]
SDKRGVKLMAIHNAKGLEFDNVFITGLEDGLFPHFLSTESGGEVEEERRLFYVALTRARKRVYLSTAKQRMAYGQIRIQSLSRFISEIPQDLLIQNKPQYQSDYTIRPNSFTATASQTEQVHSVFEAGDKVIHPQYGEGIISKRIGQDGMKQIHVKFKERTCLFIEKFSNLKKLE